MIFSERIIRAWAVLAVGILSTAVHADSGQRFPSIAATNLAGRAVSLPGDFGAPAAVVFVAFTMKQQSDIDEWKPFVDKARGKYASLAVWELPTIGTGYTFMRGIIENGMRSGIKSQAARESTVTLFVDAKAFAGNIGAAGLSEIAVLVVAADGRILGKALGKPTTASEASIDAVLGAAFSAKR